MKKIIYLVVTIGLFLSYSCSSSSEKKENNQKSELNAQTIKDCDEFLAHYEEWVDDYIKVLDDYFKNPSDPTLASKYMELMQEALHWSNKWTALVECAENEKYEKRFEEISNEVEEKLREIGL